MVSLDQIHINFDQNQVILLNICLGILMFGVALDLKWSDFLYVFRHPRHVAGGLISQWVLLPLLTLGLVWIIRPEYALALGMILIASCPGGNVSNYAVHLSGANAALSVVLTMISTVFCAFTTPVLYTELQKFLPHDIETSATIAISFMDMVMTIGQLILIPLLVGIVFSTLLPDLTARIRNVVRKLSLLIFIGFVVAAVMGNIDNLKNYLYIVFFIVLIHNSLALLIGYFWSSIIMKLPEQDSRAISIETGIQNSGLALILIFNFFDGAGGMALIAAWWSIWHLVSAMGLALWWKRKK